MKVQSACASATYAARVAAHATLPKAEARKVAVRENEARREGRPVAAYRTPPVLFMRKATPSPRQCAYGGCARHTLTRYSTAIQIRDILTAHCYVLLIAADQELFTVIIRKKDCDVEYGDVG